MATGIPTFRVDIAEGMIDVDTSADRLFAYCIEANKGPINTPTFVSSNKEALRRFGVDFAPHFYQNPTGLVIVRVGFEGAKEGKIEYKANIDGKEKTVLTIKSTSPGPCKHKVKIKKALVGDGFSLTVYIDEVTSKNYQNLSSLKKVADRINSRFSDYLVAELEKDENGKPLINKESFKNSDVIVIPNVDIKTEEEQELGKLVGGTNGCMLDKDGNPMISTYDFESFSDADGTVKWGEGKVELTGNETEGFKEVRVLENSPDNSPQGSFVNKTFYITSLAQTDGTKYPLYTDEGITEAGIYVSISLDSDNYYDVDDEKYGLNGTDIKSNEGPNPNRTLQDAYTKAFDASSYVDVIGVATLSNKEIVRNVLRTHINYMIDPEIHTYRFGITSVLSVDDPNGVRSIDSLCGLAQTLDSEWIICIGQGVVFQKENEAPYDLPPHEAVQLFTGIRSALGYSEAIFGGEQKKVLRGVVNTLPITNDGIDLIKDDIIDLNEAGICTFKKEYNEITFVEGVTTIQDEDVMSYENLMSIIAYVVKRLVKIAKPYQGQRLTEDLKSTLQTALSSELKTITESDGTLMALEEFNIPPYDVQVYSAAKTKFDETNHLVRESKIIIQCKIVPVGALRDIDLHVIAI